MTEAALAGIRVTELAQGIAGPYSGKLLGGMGAEVVKVEPPAGDWARQRRPFVADDQGVESSGLYAYLNMGKRGMVLDLATEPARDALRRLVRDTDVLIEDTTPGTLEAHGIGYAELSAVNPRLVMTRVTPFGQTGPHAGYAARELVAWNAAGYAYLTPASAPSSEEPPLKLGGNQSFFMAGISAAGATMAALIWRERSGEGQEVDVSIQEAVLVGNDSIWSQWLTWHDTVPTRAVTGSFSFLPCKDGYVSLLFVRDDQWERMVELMGNPEWAQGDLFATGHARRQNWDIVESMLSEWFVQYTKAEIIERAQARRIPVAPVNTPAEVVDSPHMAAREFFVEVDCAGAGPVKMPGPPFRATATPWRQAAPAPTLGQHGEEILTELGLAPDELATLLASSTSPSGAVAQ